MEARVLVIRSLIFTNYRFIQVALGLILISSTVSAQTRQEIRFYEANKFIQTDRVSFTSRKGKLPGCHNFLIRTRVYQANQIGYANCSLYEQKDCVSDSIVEVNRTKDDTPVTSLSQGFSWFPIDENERGAILRSWQCDLETPESE